MLDKKGFSERLTDAPILNDWLGLQHLAHALLRKLGGRQIGKHCLQIRVTHIVPDQASHWPPQSVIYLVISEGGSTGPHWIERECVFFRSFSQAHAHPISWSVSCDAQF